MTKTSFTNIVLCLLTLFAFQAQAQYSGVAYNGSTPQVGVTLGVPVKIEFENYDALSGNATGDGANFNDGSDGDLGAGGTYNDGTAGGASGGNSVRAGSDADFKAAGSGNVLTSVQGNEYLVFTINVVQAGDYHLGVNYAHGGSSKDIKVFSHASDGTGETLLYSSISAGGLPSTGNSSTYATTDNLGSFTLAAGTLLIRFKILDSGPNFDYFTLTLTGDDYNGVAYQNTIPQVGTSVGATTTIEFENYDALSSDANGDGYNYDDATNDLTVGATGTYYDDTPGGHSGGNTARAGSDVDIKAAGSGNVVTDVKPNEYLVYTINVVKAGTYQLGMNYSHGGSSKDIEVYSHATDATGKTLLYETGGAGLPTSSYVTEDNLGTFDLPAGPLLIRIRFLDTGPSFDFFTLKLITESTDYQGTAYQGTIPQVGATVGVAVQIELENYDALTSLPSGDGANFNDASDDIPSGVTGTYYDASSGGTSGGNSVRTGSDVDIKAGGSGHVLTDVAANEYTVYTINVVQAGTYSLGVNYAHGGTNKDIKIYSHATDGTGKTLLYDSSTGSGIPATGNSSTYVTNNLGSFSLPAGALLIRFRILDSGPNFDFFTLTLTALPVELTSFNAKSTTEGNVLEWQTATEEQNKGFEIQRSNDGNPDSYRDWETLDFVEGNGTSLEVQNYTYTDDAPLKGINYYRLKQIDFDGQFEYSDVVTVNYSSETGYEPFKLFPNPVTDELNIVNGQGMATIYNILGQPIREFSINNQQSTINTSDLPKGQYLLQIQQTNGNIITQQFIK